MNMDWLIKLIKEPLGGAHRDVVVMSARLKSVLIEELHGLEHLPMQKLLDQRYEKFMAMGACD